MSAYEQFTKLTAEERWYIMLHPHHIDEIKSSKDVAYSETSTRFGKNGLNDESDAFRHCFWSAWLAREIGFDGAKQFTTAHESGEGNNPKQKEMDLHNNALGLEIGRLNPNASNGTISNLCMNEVTSGRAKVIEPRYFDTKNKMCISPLK